MDSGQRESGKGDAALWTVRHRCLDKTQAALLEEVFPFTVPSRCREIAHVPPQVYRNQTDVFSDQPPLFVSQPDLFPSTRAHVGSPKTCPDPEYLSAAAPALYLTYI